MCIEPIGIIFVNGSEEVKHVATICRKLLQSAKMDIVNVSCLNSSFEIEALVDLHHIDILVVSVFCFNTLFEHMPTLFRSERLQYVWFEQIDEMFLTYDVQIQHILDVIFEQNVELQVNEFESILFNLN